MMSVKVLPHLPCRTINLVCLVTNGFIYRNGLFSKYLKIKSLSAHNKKKKVSDVENLAKILRFPGDGRTWSHSADVAVTTTHLPAPDLLRVQVRCWREGRKGM